MAGTHYTLDRDKPESQNPMDRIKEKACGRCTTVKPNDFQNFGKKLWKTRHDLTTTDVCIACQKAKVSASMKAKWAAKRVSGHDYQQEQLRMARAAYGAHGAKVTAAIEESAVTRPVSKAFGSVVLDQDEDDAPGIRRISFEDSVDLSGSEKTVVDHRVGTNVRGPVSKGLTVSDLVARDFESKK